MRQCGLPDEPQALLAIFDHTKSRLVLAAMVLVAGGLAPVYEEIVFRAGLYRFCRRWLGRNWALALSGAIFGAMHGNLAGFLPLAVLGALLALAYEATGSLRVPIVAHALFNLNTVAVVFAGLQEIGP